MLYILIMKGINMNSYGKNSKDMTYQRLHSLLETAKILNSKQDTDTILNILLKRCFELVPGGDMGAIFLYNPQTGLLEMRAFSGMGEAVKDVSLNPGESLTGIAFNKKEPVFFKDTDTIKELMDSMKEQNKSLVDKAKLDSSTVISSICCPLMHKGNPIGVLVIDNTNEATPLLEEDVEFLEAISVQATIAIVNAQNYEKELESNKSLKHYTELIEKERNNYRFSLDIHSNFTDMVLNGSTIKDILKESKKILNLEVLIIDDLFNVNYNTLDDNSILDSIKVDLPGMIKYLRSNRSMTLRNNLHDIYIHVFPIMVNKESLGWFCVLSNNEHLAELENITAERASTIIALEFLKSNDLFNMEQSLKGDFIENLILNTSPEYIEKCCAIYGLKVNGTYRTIIFSFDFNLSSRNEKQEINAIKSMNRLYSEISEGLRHCFSSVFSIVKGTNIIAIVESGDFPDSDSLDSSMDEIQTRISNLDNLSSNNYDYKISMSNIFSEINNFSQSYKNAEYALKIISKYNKKSRYLCYDNIEIKRFLSGNNKDDLLDFVEKILGPIMDYKSSSQKEFLKTLEIYIKSNCSWSYTKDALHIHGNTLSYRLNKISDILKLNLNNYRDKLKIQIAFEIIELLE